MLLEFSLNYPDTAESLWFYSKYEAVKFNKHIASNNNSKSLECEPRPIGNKVELKLKWSNQCVSSANDNENTDADPNDIIFTIKETKLYAYVVTLSTKDN